MNSRLTAILQELMASDTVVTSDHLARKVDVTSRTIRDDLKQLERLLLSNGASINSIRGKGYELEVQEEQEFRKFLQQTFQQKHDSEAFQPNLPEERVKYLIRRLLLAEGYLKLDDLSDEIHISKSTIQNDLKSVKEILKEYGIALEKRPNYGLKIKGSEVKLRFCMSEYIFDRSGEGSPNTALTSELSSLAGEKELSEIWKIIIEQIEENDITLSDIAINNLFVHIAIAYKRITSGYHVKLYKADLKEIITQKEYIVAKKIVQKAEQVLQVKFPPVEIAYIAIHLLGTKMITTSNMSEQEIGNVLEDEVYQLTIAVLDAIEERLHLGIRHDTELIMGLGLHLKPAINRYRYGMNIRNPMLEDIKVNYQVAFEAGIIAGLALEEHFGAKIDENEIGYLALHIGAAMERRKLESGPKRCLIVCASGMGSAQLLNYKVQAKFGSKIKVMGTTEFYKLNQVDFENVDFVISSIPIRESLPVPVIEVNTILGEGDLQKIEGFIQENQTSVSQYVKEGLVFLQKPLASTQEVLEYLVHQVMEKGLAEEGFLEAVLQRESMAPTSFGNSVAIPHPISPLTPQTFLAFCTLEKPIVWGDKKVQFVCLLSVEKESNEDFQNMYNMLGKIVDNNELVQRLLKAKTYTEFLRNLL
ncbi:BglG family transcription antiterminator [Radiobacillus kanasensis]|uniref:BglG family transcription antiterminator n=1 Tax=Radiobacillus kanasensis TaxID=2844358 RepID=UPI001E5F5CD6|nr:BglG family transcription antiterminator [Radiobacillus kanasensis]UFT99145.1 BglG family transcription antiterminator [Radiobacillus kanasensis]